jgi:two-component system, NarL family, nitrate/nitrite response regulator NarL
MAILEPRKSKFVELDQFAFQCSARQTGGSQLSRITAFTVPKVERLARLHVVLALRNQVERLGIERMFASLDAVGSYRSHENLAAAIEDAVLHESAVLVIALREIDQVAGSLLGTATRQGVKLLVLIDDDLTNLSRLAGVRSSGFASISDLNVNRLSIAFQRMRSGELPIPPQVAQFLFSVVSEGYDAGRFRTRVRMTPREQEVLCLLVDGLSNQQIARRLRISVHGAKRHVANVLAKLNCSNRTLAVAKALREGLCGDYLKQQV